MVGEQRRTMSKYPFKSVNPCLSRPLGSSVFKHNKNSIFNHKSKKTKIIIASAVFIEVICLPLLHLSKARQIWIGIV